MELAEYERLLETRTDHVAFLTEAFKSLHHNAPGEDFERLGSRMAGLLKVNNRDTKHILKYIWQSKDRQIIGSHINFIQGMLSADKKGPDDTAARCYGRTPAEVNDINAGRIEEFYARQGRPVPGGILNGGSLERIRGEE